MNEPTSEQPTTVKTPSNEKPDRLKLVLGVVFVVWLVAGTVLWFSLENLTQRGQFGDMFGAVNALFSGLAMAGVIYAVYMQKEELALQRHELQAQREEMSKMVGTQVRQLHISIQTLGMECDDLAAVWAHKAASNLSVKQAAYINLILSHWELLFAEKLLKAQELTVLLKQYFAESVQFKAFWPDACEHRKAMARAAGGKSLEFHDLAQAAFDNTPK